MLPSLVSPASSMMDGGDDQNVATPVNVESSSENKIAQGDNNGQSMVQPTDSGKDQADPDMKMNWGNSLEEIWKVHSLVYRIAIMKKKD